MTFLSGLKRPRVLLTVHRETVTVGFVDSRMEHLVSVSNPRIQLVARVGEKRPRRSGIRLEYILQTAIYEEALRPSRR